MVIKLLKAMWHLRPEDPLKGAGRPGLSVGRERVDGTGLSLMRRPMEERARKKENEEMPKEEKGEEDGGGGRAMPWYT